MRQDFARPRLVLVTTPLADDETGPAALRAALSAGDVATVIIDPAGRSGSAFQTFAEPLVAVCREHEVAAVVVDDTQCFGRAKADGLHLSGGDVESLRDAVERFSPRSIVGASGFLTRHDALEAGERLPDYILFGALGADTGAAPHGPDLELAEWWAEIVEVPCIVLGGNDVEAIEAAVLTGAEFIALSRAVFADPSPATVTRQVERANALLDDVTRRLAA